MWPFKSTFDSRVPDDTRIYAIGDIHGCLPRLRALHGEIQADAAAAPERRRVLVYVGDYVDRGPDSAEVLDELLDRPLPGFEIVTLMGNHEDFMLRFWDGDLDAGAGWIANGGAETLISYGIDVGSKWPEASELKMLQGRFAAAAPPRHRGFLQSLALYHVEGDYAFVHAGVRPGVPLCDQAARDLLWIRETFLDHSGPHGHVVVHGHTPVRRPEDRANRINVDTGAVYGGPLTCVVLAGDTRRFIQI